MKKPILKKNLRQKRNGVFVLKRNLRARNLEIQFKNLSKNGFLRSFKLPENIFLYKKSFRRDLIKILDFLSYQTKDSDPVLLDFKNVKKLDAASTNYFVHNLNKLSYVPIKGRSSDSKTVRSMFTRLKIDKRLGLKSHYCDYTKVNKWHIARGTTSDLEGGYDVIENALIEKFGIENEDFYIINEAISEAINNVVDHAYDADSVHKEWLIFLAVEGDVCSVVISDLGQTIPVSVPKKVDDHLKNSLIKILKLDFLNLHEIDDAKLIEIASIYRRTSTHAKHRGKGFSNMMAVCSQVPNSQLYVYSRNGLWMMGHNKQQKLTNYNSTVNGTIIYWSIPLKGPLMVDTSTMAA